MSLLEFLQRQRATAYRGFAGAAVRGSLPITESVVNEAIQASAAGHSSVVHQLRVTLHDDNQLVVSGTIRKWFFSKRFAIALWIEPEIDFARAPRIRAWLPRSSMLGSIAHLLTTFGVWLPRSVQVSGELVEIDLAALLYQYNVPELVYWIKFLHVAIVRERLVLSFFVQIDPPLNPHGVAEAQSAIRLEK